MSDLISRNKLLVELNDQIKACERAPHDSRLYRWAAGLKAGVVIVNGLDGEVAEPAIPDEELDAIEARCNAATPGPWVAGRGDVATIVDGYESKWIYAKDRYLAIVSGYEIPNWEEVMANARFIAASSTDIPRLVAEVRRLRENGKLITGETSDGYHTFNELYHHRAVLFSVICNDRPELTWKSKLHHDGTMYNGMFIVGIETPDGQATYHYNIDPYWDMFKVKEMSAAPEWDGHTPAQAIDRIGGLSAAQRDTVPVVRCRKCENATMTVNGELKYCEFWQPDGGDALYLPGDFFCGEGKRMDADTPERAETLDAVPVVRCRGCISHSEYVNEYGDTKHLCREHDEHFDADFYCGKGKRKEEPT